MGSMTAVVGGPPQLLVFAPLLLVEGTYRHTPGGPLSGVQGMEPLAFVFGYLGILVFVGALGGRVGVWLVERNSP